ncbi:YkgJ family cysteine cluster protein [Dyella sp. ASV21]|uniref:YkgJ family cysteine cluster protein n=1 Tax=Dyella sp. ASV21 TaxID=2795114 RepID=UPI0018EDE518|nr:YkgJ family cysteine cluster protein [Dyella sp. ASV21]
MVHPCLRCGVCCTQYRVAFHWSEAEPSLGGVVPVELTEPLDPHRLVMRGTQAYKPHCIALRGELGKSAYCSIHPRRPSVCREVEPSWEFGRPSSQCDRARLAHGMPVLTPQDWEDLAAANASETTPAQ